MGENVNKALPPVHKVFHTCQVCTHFCGKLRIVDKRSGLTPCYAHVIPGHCL